MTQEQYNIIFSEAEKVKNELRTNFDEHPLETTYALLQSIDDINKRLDIESKVACKGKGCNFCCHDRVYLSSFEINLIKTFIEQNPDYQFVNEEQAKFLDETGYIEANNLPFAKRACPFLINGNCSIYDVRPSICRIHNISKSEDINKCKREKDTDITDEIVNVQAHILSTSFLCMDFENGEPIHNLLEAIY